MNDFKTIGQELDKEIYEVEKINNRGNKIMKTKLKEIAHEIKLIKAHIKDTQRSGNYPTYSKLIKLQFDYRHMHIASTLIHKRVSLEELSIQKILDLGIEIKSKKKEYDSPNINIIKQHMENIEND